MGVFGSVFVGRMKTAATGRRERNRPRCRSARESRDESVFDGASRETRCSATWLRSAEEREIERGERHKRWTEDRG